MCEISAVNGLTVAIVAITVVGKSWPNAHCREAAAKEIPWYNPHLYLTPEISTFLMRVIRAKIRYIHCTFEQSRNGPINDAHTHVANEVSNN